MREKSNDSIGELNKKNPGKEDIFRKLEKKGKDRERQWKKR